MSDRKHTDKDYLFLSTLLRARTSAFISEDTLERMLTTGKFQEAAAVLHEQGWPDMSDLDRTGVDKVLSERREEIFAELEKLCPDKELVNLFRLRYDYHNAKAIIKGQAMDADANGLLSKAGRVELGRLKEAFITEDYRFIPKTLGKAMKEARDVLARTGNPSSLTLCLIKHAMKRTSALPQSLITSMSRAM